MSGLLSFWKNPCHNSYQALRKLMAPKLKQSQKVLATECHSLFAWNFGVFPVVPSLSPLNSLKSFEEHED